MLRRGRSRKQSEHQPARAYLATTFIPSRENLKKKAAEVGYGFSKSYPMEQKMRDAWGWGIAGGSIDIQKVNIAAALVGRRFNQRG